MAGNTRKNSLEQYYTLPEVAQEFAEHVVKIYGLDARYLDPCGGRGAFVEALIRAGVAESNIVSVDIDPRHRLVRAADFLADAIAIDPGFIAITNPPYGRACSLAIKFFNRCASLKAKSIAFLIPSSFNKVAIADRLDLSFHQREAVLAPSTSYYTDAGGIDTRGRLSTEFQIWEHRNTLRPRRKCLRHPWIEFVSWPQVKAGASYDFCIRTHGSGCGQLLNKDYAGSLRVSDGKNTHLNFRTVAFIRSKHKELKATLETMDFSRFSQAVSYIPCVSPAEICILLAEKTGVACV